MATLGKHQRALRRPILDGDSADRRKVGILRHDDTIGKCSRYRPDLHVNLLNGTASALQFDKDPPVFRGRCCRVRSNCQFLQGTLQPRDINLPLGASFDAAP